MEDSQISFAGALGPFYSGGLWIETNDTMIINSKIHDNYVYGVYIRDAKNVVIVNTTIYNCGIGIYLDNISTAKILSCTGTKTGTAIIIWRSLYVLIRNCYVTNSQYFGIRVWKSNWVRIENSLLANNTIEGITVWNSPFTTVFNNTIGKGGYGIAVRETPIITISSNNVYNTSIGVYLERTAGPTSTTIYPFTKPPLEISIRPLNTIVNNRIFNNTYGGYFYDVGLAKFCKNDMRNNVYGMHFVKAIGIETCPNIFIFQNNFVENENHWTQKDSMLIFQFHNTTHGNFWDNYSGNDDEGDGIGDTPYQIDGVFDYYPLMEPVDVGSSVDNLYPNIVTAREVLENGTLLEITAQVTDTSELVWTMINWTLGNESRIDPIYVAIVYFPDLETGNNEFQMLPPETVEDYRNVTFTLLLNLNEDFPENVTREYRIYSADTFGNWGEWPIPPTIENSNPPASIINLTDVKFTAKVKGDVKKVIMILNERHYNMSLNEQFQLYEIILTLTEGFHNWYLTAEDYLGRTDIIPMRKMTVDVTPPKIINVSQIPPQDKVQSEDEVKVNATVTDAITKVKQVLLNYTFTNSSGTWFNLIDMTNLKDNVWNATIPAFPYGTNVTYRIIATDTANNTVVSDNLGYVYSYEVIPEIPSMLIFLLFIVTTTIVTVTYKVKQCKSTQ
jgi:parallel beta-helix repeat protein